MFGILKRALNPIQEQSKKKKVLNVGGNSKAIPIPPEYDSWDHILLDIDPKGNPDVVCDARQLTTLSANEYDSIYCSHNLEHYYSHDVKRVLLGFFHVLKDDGFVCIRVPDMGEVMSRVVKEGLDIEDVLYQSAIGPIKVKDVMYGYGVEIESSGNEYFAHKTGFTEKSLNLALHQAGFTHVYLRTGNLEVAAFAFKNAPNDEYSKLLNL